jgi:hypothetical protein
VNVGLSMGVEMTAVLLVLLAVAPSDERALGEAKAAALAFEAARSSLDSYRCEYQHIKAFASDWNRARTGEVRSPRHCDIEHAYRHREKQEEFFSVRFKLPDLASSKRESKEVYSEFLPFEELRYGDHSLFSFAPWRAANLRIGAQTRPRQEPTPLAYGDFFHGSDYRSPFSAIQRVLEGKAVLQSKGAVVIDGLPTIHLLIEESTGALEFWLDPQRGFLPVECEWRVLGQDGKARVQLRSALVNAKDCGKGRWFPLHIICGWSPPDGGDRVLLSIVRVSRLQIDNEVDDEDFQLTLPAGWYMYRNSAADSPFSAFRLRQLEKVLPAQLPKLEKKFEEAQSNPRMDTALPRSSPSIRRYLAASVAALLGFLGLAGVGRWVIATRRRPPRTTRP